MQIQSNLTRSGCRSARSAAPQMGFRCQLREIRSPRIADLETRPILPHRAIDVVDFSTDRARADRSQKLGVRRGPMTWDSVESRHGFESAESAPRGSSLPWWGFQWAGIRGTGSVSITGRPSLERSTGSPAETGAIREARNRFENALCGHRCVDLEFEARIAARTVPRETGQFFEKS